MKDNLYLPDLITKHGLRRGLSHRTIKTYRQCIKKFFSTCNKHPLEVNKKDIHDYLDNLIQKGAGGNTINVYLNSLRFLYFDVFNKKFMVRIRFSKTPKTLPTVLTKEEVKRLINAIDNTKHKLIVKLLYSAGLRVSELVNLKICDLELDKNYGWVRHGKGDKDRLFIIAKTIKYELISYITDENLTSESWLFEGTKYNHLSVASVKMIIKKAARKAKIAKNVHHHTLRHSFATHLIENEYDVLSVQSLLGHSKADTTMTYLHMASPKMINVKSPIDDL
ncbi:tyrosine-type recombinase/integrase [Candidatus Woesearchaeota archaeon]|nr:tyrosine-type recombinase/integrase [Candidatus Woesearchaeota archaeon]